MDPTITKLESAYMNCLTTLARREDYGDDVTIRYRDCAALMVAKPTGPKGKMVWHFIQWVGNCFDYSPENPMMLRALAAEYNTTYDIFANPGHLIAEPYTWVDIEAHRVVYPDTKDDWLRTLRCGPDERDEHE